MFLFLDTNELRYFSFFPKFHFVSYLNNLDDTDNGAPAGAYTGSLFPGVRRRRPLGRVIINVEEIYVLD